MENMDIASILIFCFVWIFLTFVTYGVAVPSGLFLPGIIIGCCVGLLFLQVMLSLGYSIWTVGGQPYIIMGACAMLTAYCRLTYSLTVIMLETTQSINLFLPMIFTILTAKFVAEYWNRSLYDYALRGKQIPVLRGNVSLGYSVPPRAYSTRAKDLMTEHPLCVESICTVSRIA